MEKLIPVDGKELTVFVVEFAMFFQNEFSTEANVHDGIRMQLSDTEKVYEWKKEARRLVNFANRK